MARLSKKAKAQVKASKKGKKVSAADAKKQASDFKKNKKKRNAAQAAAPAAPQATPVVEPVQPVVAPATAVSAPVASPTAGELFTETTTPETGLAETVERDTQAVATGDPNITLATQDPELTGTGGGGAAKIGTGAGTGTGDPSILHQPTTPVGIEISQKAGNIYGALELFNIELPPNFFAKRNATDLASPQQKIANWLARQPDLMRDMELAAVSGDMPVAQLVALVESVNANSANGWQFATIEAQRAVAQADPESKAVTSQFAAPAPGADEVQAEIVAAGGTPRGQAGPLGTAPAVEDVPATTGAGEFKTIGLNPTQRAVLKNPSDIGTIVGELQSAIHGGNPKMITQALSSFNVSLPPGVSWDTNSRTFDTSLLGDLVGFDAVDPAISEYLALITPAFILKDIAGLVQGQQLSDEQNQALLEFEAKVQEGLNLQAHEFGLIEQSQQINAEIASLQEQLEFQRSEGTLDREQETELAERERALTERLTQLQIGSQEAQQFRQQQFEESFAKLQQSLDLDTLKQQQDLFQIDAPVNPKDARQQVSGLISQGSELFKAPYSPAKFAKMQEWSAQVGSLQVPAGVTWNPQTGDFVLREGFGGRKLTPEAVEYMASIRGAFQMRDNIMQVAEVEQQTHLQIQAQDTIRRNQEQAFNDAIQSGNISSAEQALAVQRIAESDKLKAEQKLLPIQMGLQLFSNPVMLGLAQFYGFTAQLEEALGIQLPTSNFGKANGDATAFGLEDFLKADQATRGIMQATFSSQTGGGQDEFFKSIMSGAPAQAAAGAEVQRV